VMEEGRQEMGVFEGRRETSNQPFCAASSKKGGCLSFELRDSLLI